MILRNLQRVGYMLKSIFTSQGLIHFLIYFMKRTGIASMTWKDGWNQKIWNLSTLSVYKTCTFQDSDNLIEHVQPFQISGAHNFEWEGSYVMIGLRIEEYLIQPINLPRLCRVVLLDRTEKH